MEQKKGSKVTFAKYSPPRELDEIQELDTEMQQIVEANKIESPIQEEACALPSNSSNFSNEEVLTIFTTSKEKFIDMYFEVDKTTLLEKIEADTNMFRTETMQEIFRSTMISVIKKVECICGIHPQSDAEPYTLATTAVPDSDYQDELESLIKQQEKLKLEEKEAEESDIAPVPSISGQVARKEQEPETPKKLKMLEKSKQLAKNDTNDAMKRRIRIKRRRFRVSKDKKTDKHPDEPGTSRDN